MPGHTKLSSRSSRLRVMRRVRSSWPCRRDRCDQGEHVARWMVRRFIQRFPCLLHRSPFSQAVISPVARHRPMATIMHHWIPCFVAVLLIAAAPLLAAEPRHEVVKDWPVLPADHVLGLCAGVGVDSHDHVFVFHRRERVWSTPFPTEPIAATTVSIIDGKSGKLITSWGAGLFIMPHGLTIDREDNVWLTDVGLHQVFKFTPDGKLLLTLGERATPGADHSHFNLPTDVAVLQDGSFYVSDGYKNTRVVKFAADGRYEFEWGGKGDGPGQFNLPHGIALDAKGRVFVCDRSNSRLHAGGNKGCASRSQ